LSQPDLDAASERIYLVLDQFSAHTSEEVIQRARELNIDLIYVPAGLTSELQPLDVGVNAVIKAKQSATYRRHQRNNNTRPYKADEALKDLTEITMSMNPDVVQKTWKKVVEAARKRVLELNSLQHDESQGVGHSEEYEECV
jgi:hypothetical protein